MSDWLRALQAAPSAPPGLLDFAATQPSLAATWQNATRGDWVIWLAARAPALNSPRDLVDATVILADFAPASSLRRALSFTAGPEDVLRKLNFEKGDFDLGQIVAHVYLGLALGTLAGSAAYVAAAGHSLLFREGVGILALLVICVVVTLLAQAIWKSSVARKSAPVTFENAVPLALAVAVAVSERSSVMKQVDGARIMRKRLAPPVA